MDAEHFKRFAASLTPAFADGDSEAAAKAVEAANVHRLRELYEAIGRGDTAALFIAFAEDVELDVVGPPGVPFVGRCQGRRQVAETVRQNFAKVENLKPEMLAVIAQGDTVVVYGRDQGRYVPTGRDFSLHWVQFFTFRNGRVVRIRQLFDSAAILAAAAPVQG